MYEKNIRLLENAVLTRAVIRNVSMHRKADGSLDVEGNLKLWDKAMEPFEKISLWEPHKTPGYDHRDPGRQSLIWYLFRRIQLKWTAYGRRKVLHRQTIKRRQPLLLPMVGAFRGGQAVKA